MRFRTYTNKGEVALDASVAERTALVEFIDASLTSKQVDYDEHSPVDRDMLRSLRESIAAQSSADTAPLVVARVAFWNLDKVAAGWHFFGYRGLREDVELDVPRTMVNAILALSDEAPRYIGPSEL